MDDGRGASPALDMATTGGLISAFKTNNVILDALIAMCIPFFLKLVLLHWIPIQSVCCPGYPQARVPRGVGPPKKNKSKH